MRRSVIVGMALAGGMPAWGRSSPRLLCLGLVVALTGCASFGECGLRECPADAKISAEVRSLLGDSPALSAPNLISVQTTRGVVYLRGVVSTPYQIAEAGNIAERAPGVADVENLLHIDNAI